MIVKKAAPLFNQKGYFGAAISDIMQETGLKKGGIYNYFESKESLALEAFDYAVSQVELWFSNKVNDKKTADEKLFAIIHAFKEYAESPPVPGGCPLLNTAVESDDAHPALRKRTQQAMDRSRQRLIGIVNQGMVEGTIRSDVHPDTVATIFISAFEGALMMCRLYGDTSYMNQITDHLMSYLNTHVIAQ
jgi:TetR/AcrR family transcriptional repressor of nem operon